MCNSTGRKICNFFMPAQRFDQKTEKKHAQVNFLTVKSITKVLNG